LNNLVDIHFSEKLELTKQKIIPAETVKDPQFATFLRNGQRIVKYPT